MASSQDRLADELNDIESRHDQTGMLLFLHSFSRVEDQVFEYHEKETGKGTTIGPLPYYTHPQTRSFDRRIHSHLIWDIEEATIGLGRLVRLGGPTIYKQASFSLRYPDHDNWFQIMQRSARVARLMILIPECSDGLVRELIELRDSGHYRKTITHAAGAVLHSGHSGINRIGREVY